MRAAVDCGEMDRGDVREEIVVGNACGGKPGSRGSWIASMIDPRSLPRSIQYRYTAESHGRGGAITVVSLSPHTSIVG